MGRRHRVGVRVGLALTALLVGGCGVGGDGALSKKEVFEKGRKATVQLYGTLGDAFVGGTGVVIDSKEGLVLTNAHVISGLAGLKAKALDKTEVSAQVVGTAPCDDLAVVKLSPVPKGITAIGLGDSDAVANQDEVTALGYPASFADPTSETIVSTNGTVQSPKVAAEPDPSLPKYPSTIQHSATINHGNSGGPLLDDRGRLIGINTLGNEGTVDQPIQGQYYAISVNHIKPLVPELVAGNSIAHPGWDVAAFSKIPLSDVFEETGYGTAAEGDQADQVLIERGIDGVFVFGVDAGSPAEDADLAGGDLITAIDNVPVTTTGEVCDVLKSSTGGQTLRIDGYYLTSGDVQQFGQAWTTEVTLD